MSDLPNVRSVQLEKLCFALQVPISEELIDVTIEFEDNWIIQAIVAEIRGAVWAEKLETKEVRYPSDWWQAFKEQYFPTWAKERWPVRYEVVRFDVKALYPHLRLGIPSERSGGAVVRVFEGYGTQVGNGRSEGDQE